MNQDLKIAILDTNTLTYGDLDFSPIEACGNVTFHDLMPQEELANAIGTAEVAVVNISDSLPPATTTSIVKRQEKEVSMS